MSMGAPGLIEGLIAEAGFSEIVTHRVTLFHEIADPETEWQRGARTSRRRTVAVWQASRKASNSDCMMR